MSRPFQAEDTYFRERARLFKNASSLEKMRLTSEIFEYAESHLELISFLLLSRQFISNKMREIQDGRFPIREEGVTKEEFQTVSARLIKSFFSLRTVMRENGMLL